MSGPNTQYMVDRDDRPAPAPDPEMLPLKPGVVLELHALGTRLDDLIMAFADIKLGRAHENYPTFERRAHSYAALATHFAALVTASRPRPPERAQSTEE